MKHICNRFITAYDHIDREILISFNSIICEIEILIDSVDEFLLNKYYKEKSMGVKLYFKEEQIQELTFYLTKRTEKTEEKT